MIIRSRKIKISLPILWVLLSQNVVSMNAAQAEFGSRGSLETSLQFQQAPIAGVSAGLVGAQFSAPVYNDTLRVGIFGQTVTSKIKHEFQNEKFDLGFYEWGPLLSVHPLPDLSLRPYFNMRFAFGQLGYRNQKDDKYDSIATSVMEGQIGANYFVKPHTAFGAGMGYRYVKQVQGLDLSAGDFRGLSFTLGITTTY